MTCQQETHNNKAVPPRQVVMKANTQRSVAKNDRRIIWRIRKHCLECCDGSPKEVRFCPITTCDLWAFRFGCKPKSAVRRLGKNGKSLLDESYFQEGGKFSPDKSISEIEP